MSINVSDEKEFTAHTWWAKAPEFVIKTLSEQLEGAKAVWPELKEYRITKRRIRNLEK